MGRDRGARHAHGRERLPVTLRFTLPGRCVKQTCSVPGRGCVTRVLPAFRFTLPGRCVSLVPARGPPRATEPTETARRATASLCPRTGLHSGLASRSRARDRDLRRTREGGRLPFRLHGGPRLGSCVPAVTPEWKPGSSRDDVANARLAPSQDGGCDSDASPRRGELGSAASSARAGRVYSQACSEGCRSRLTAKGADGDSGVPRCSRAAPPGSSLRCVCSQR